MKTEQQLPLVSFEQASRLRELGFSWETIQFHYVDFDKYKPNVKFNDLVSLKETLTTSNHYRNWNTSKSGNHISAPTVALALKWFRDVKRVRNSVVACERGYYGVISGEDFYETEDFDTYELAESALLDELLTVISPQIEKEK